ncbi:hypothetical protein G9A89_021809 [Geosiphon pyriformis]|nr:hypothetical protein G9A89_021809 [Geosiphon pyriformis]
MSAKKLARGATNSSVSGNLRQKPKVSLEKVKHLSNEANLSFKLSASNSGWYENINIFSNEKLEHEIGKNMGYGAGSKSDRPLDSSTNTPKAKCFNTDMVKTQFLSLCNFGSTINNVNMDLSSPVSLESSLCPVFSVKERLCFKLAKFFVLNIGLSAIPGTTLHNKLKSVRKLFYKINSFRGMLIPSKFLGIVRVSFTSEFSLILAKQLAVSENFVVNADLKKIGI